MPAKNISDIWNGRAFVWAISVGVVFYVALRVWLSLYVFANPKLEYLPSLEGTYKCCYASGRYSASYVSRVPVNCYPFTYFLLGTGRNDCGYKEELDGKYAKVERLLLPSFFGSNPIVFKLSDESKVYFNYTEETMLEMWRNGTIRSASTIAILPFGVVYMLMLYRAEKKRKGDSK